MLLTSFMLARWRSQSTFVCTSYGEVEKPPEVSFIILFSLSHFIIPAKDLECLGRLNRCIYRLRTERHDVFLSEISKKVLWWDYSNHLANIRSGKCHHKFRSKDNHFEDCLLLINWNDNVDLVGALLLKTLVLCSANLFYIISFELIFIFNSKCSICFVI